MTYSNTESVYFNRKVRKDFCKGRKEKPELLVSLRPPSTIGSEGYPVIVLTQGAKFLPFQIKSFNPPMLKDCPFPKIFPSGLQTDDTYFMKLAYNQAIDAWQADETPVGAVIERDGKVIASAHNQVETLKDPTAHAEVLAITQASRALGDWRLKGATLYVTKEPCPMCTGAVLLARFARVVYAFSDPKMGCLGGATDLNALSQINHHCLLTRGVLEAECRALIRAFFVEKRGHPSTGVDS